MASILETIMGQLSGDGMKQISRQLGTDETKAGAATGAAVTTLLGALSKNASSSDGADSLSRALAKDHDGSILDNLSGFLSNAQQGPGEGILRHVLGNRQPAVESSLGQATGLDGNSMGQLMTMVAPVVLGVLGKNQRQQGLDASALSGLLGQERQTMEREQPQITGAVSKLLDADGDGDVDMGDLAKHGMGLLGKFLGK